MRQQLNAGRPLVDDQRQKRNALESTVTQLEARLAAMAKDSSTSSKVNSTR